MYKGFNKIFWGLIFFYIAIINIGSMRIPPVFVSWIIILLGVNEVLAIQSEEKFKILKKLVTAMIVITLIQEILSFIHLPILNNRSFVVFLLMIKLIELAIYYYTMEGAKEMICEDNMYLAHSMEVTLRNIIISHTILMLVNITAILLENAGLFIFSAVGFLIIHIVFIYWVRRVRNTYKIVTVKYE
jgi:hypothetical protein